MIKAIIIDDEALARNIVKKFLEKHQDVELVAECNDGFEGLKCIKEKKADVLFLDVTMPKLNGLEMLELMEENIHVIFVTAYEEYAIQAFEHNAVDYLLKPYAQERFDKAIDKLREKMALQEQHSTKKLAQKLQERDEPLWRVVVKNRGVVKIINIDDIFHIEADDDYVFIHTQKERFIKHATMKMFEKRLPEKNFMRVHRSAIINITQIEKIEAYTKETHSILLKNGEKVKTSRTGSQKLKARLGF